VTRDRVYTDTMQQVYTNVTKVLVDSRQGSNLLYLPLDKIMQMSAQGDAAASADAAPTAGGAAPAVIPNSPSSNIPLDARSRDTARTRERETR